jgi:hypothetical protein
VTAGETYFVLAHVANDIADLDEVIVNIYSQNQTQAGLDTPFASLTLDAELTGKLRNLSVQKLAAVDDNTQEMYFDEFRMGTTLADVVIPEPATLALVSIGGVFALLRRNRS